jgi:lipoprotein signal peptidase
MLVIGGALSNALDRLLYGAVADFFHFHWQDWSFYIFNLADMAITVGVLLLILDSSASGGRQALDRKGASIWSYGPVSSMASIKVLDRPARGTG